MSHATDVRGGHSAARGTAGSWPGRGPIEVDPARWPDVAVVPGSPVRAAIARLLFARVAARLPLRVRLPSGAVFGGGGPGAPVLALHRPADFYQRVGAAGLIGFGESYMAGDWDADDLTGLLTVLARQVDSLVPRQLQWLRNAYVRRQPPDEDASETGARRNIQRHYDLSNELFALFLDETMTYSAALFEEDGRVSVDLLDYRRVDGQYDAIVSVEMIEAVAERYWPEYFAVLDRLLAPGGRLGLQAITMPHQRMLASRRTQTWILKYIFPGGLIPSVTSIEANVAAHTRLRVASRRGFGRHYAETLRLWRERLLARPDELARLGFDEVFGRMWLLYLCYAEAGFRSGYLDVSQFLLAADPGRAA